MTAATEPAPPPADRKKSKFDPDEYRMSIGDHLEELRRRIIFGLIGFVVAAVFCLIFGKHFIGVLCKPLADALLSEHITTQLVTREVTDVFMVYIQVSLSLALAVASPWIVYQLWLFIAAGLYPNERKYITRYVPLSITLLIVGMAFVYFIVLPLSLRFFIAFSASIPLDIGGTDLHVPVAIQPTSQPTYVEGYRGNPTNPEPFQLWFDVTEQRLKMYYDGAVRVIPFGPPNLVMPNFTLPDYIDLVIRMLLTFGLAFQLPLVVLALERIGIVDVPRLKGMRRYVYFIMGVVAAFLTPGDMVTTMLALMLPLILLYELGIWLAKRKPPAENAAA